MNYKAIAEIRYDGEIKRYESRVVSQEEKDQIVDVRDFIKRQSSDLFYHLEKGWHFTFEPRWTKDFLVIAEDGSITMNPGSRIELIK